MKMKDEHTTQKFIAANQAWADAAKIGSFKTKAAKKELLQLVNSIYNDIYWNDEYRNNLFGWNFDLPFDLHCIRDRHIAELRGKNKKVGDMVDMLARLRHDVNIIPVAEKDKTPADEKPVKVKNGRLVPYAEIKPIRERIKELLARADAELLPLVISWHLRENEQRRRPRDVESVTRDATNGFRDQCEFRNYKIAKKLVEISGGVKLDTIDPRGNIFDGWYLLRSECGAKFNVRIQTISAGGYNIQCFHHRILVNGKKAND